MFKVDAHKSMDRVGKLGRDMIIAESLDAASRGSGEYTVIHRSIQDRLRTLIPDLASSGIGIIAAIDNKGRVIARVGENDKEYGDYIGGAELIADALRGYLSDDVWGMGGKLERVAAAPVLSKGRDRIVGAIYVGAETGEALVERLKKNLEVDVALLLRGKVIASSRAVGELDGLPELAAQHTKEIETVKRRPSLSRWESSTCFPWSRPSRGKPASSRPTTRWWALAGEHGPLVADLERLVRGPQVGQFSLDSAPRRGGAGHRAWPLPATHGSGKPAAALAPRPPEAGVG